MIHTAEFDISMLIYLALAIIAAIGSIFQKRAQAKAKGAPPAEQENNSPWEELFGEPEPRYENKTESPFEEYEPEPVVSPYDTVPRAKEELKVEAPLDSVPAWSSINKTSEQMFGHEADLEPAYEYEDIIKATEIGGHDETQAKPAIEIDLKKAVIYSEIIQRKY